VPDVLVVPAAPLVETETTEVVVARDVLVDSTGATLDDVGKPELLVMSALPSAEPEDVVALALDEEVVAPATATLSFVGAPQLHAPRASTTTNELTCTFLVRRATIVIRLPLSPRFEGT
jgi:hypothetical protein